MIPRVAISHSGAGELALPLHRLEQRPRAPVPRPLLFVAVRIGAGGELVQPDEPFPRLSIAPLRPEEPEEGVAAQVAAREPIDQVAEQRALLVDLAIAAGRDRLVVDGVVGERRLRILAGEGLPQRARRRLAADGLELRQHVQRPRSHVRLRAAEHDLGERRARARIFALLAKRPPLVELHPTGQRIARFHRREVDVLRRRLMLLGVRAQRPQSRLQEASRAPVAGTSPEAEGRDHDAGKLVQRLAVAMGIEQHLRPPHQQDLRDVPAGTELPLPIARRIGGGQQRVLDPGCAPVAARLLLRSRGELCVARDQVGRGDVRPDLPSQDRLEDLLDPRGSAGPGDAPIHRLARALEEHLVCIDVSQRHLREQPLRRPCRPLVDGAERRHVQGAIRQRTALHRELLEQRPRRFRVVRRLQSQRLEPPGRRIRRPAGKESQGIRRPPRLQFAQGRLCRGSGEIRSQFGFADGRTTLHGLHVRVRGERIRWRRNPRGAQHHGGEAEKAGDHRGLGRSVQSGIAGRWRPVAEPVEGHPSFRAVP